VSGGVVPPRRPDDAILKVGWQREVLADLPALHVFAEQARAAFPDLDTIRDAEWIGVAHDWPSNPMLVLSSRAGGELLGVAALAISKAPLVYSFGPIVFLKPVVTHYKLEHDLVCRHGDRVQSIGDCFDALFDAMPDGSVVFAGAVSIESQLYEQFLDPNSTLRRKFHVLAWGGESMHCRIRWEGSVEKYMATIGKKSSKELRRNAKALFGDPSLKCDFRRFQTPDEAEVFLRDGASLSDKTWQKREFQQGIALDSTVGRVIRFAAAHGDFIGYIIYINGAPAAFRYGFKCGTTLTLKQIGHDPAWSARQIGTVMFFEVLCDLERIKLPVVCLDFTPMLNLFKLRTANDRRRIRHFYMFKRTLLGTLQYTTVKATDSLSRAIGSLIKKPKEGELEKYLARADISRGKT
jgi:Acetyltransferase (GNAT) domain